MPGDVQPTTLEQLYSGGFLPGKITYRQQDNGVGACALAIVVPFEITVGVKLFLTSSLKFSPSAIRDGDRYVSGREIIVDCPSPAMAAYLFSRIQGQFMAGVEVRRMDQ